MATNDPRHEIADMDDICPKCKKVILRGDAIYYWPKTKRAYCEACGREDYRRCMESIADEDN